MQILRRTQQAERYHTRGHMWRYYTHTQSAANYHLVPTAVLVALSSVMLHVLTAPHLKEPTDSGQHAYSKASIFTQERKRLSPLHFDDALPLRASPTQHAHPPVATTAAVSAATAVDAGFAFTLGCLDQATPALSSLCFASRITTQIVDALWKHCVFQVEYVE